MTKRKIETGNNGAGDAASSEIKRSRGNSPEADIAAISASTAAGSTADATDKMSSVSWGEWMGSWKASLGEVDAEQERIDRQKAAFGGDTVARIKDLNVLIVGSAGCGVETAKNLILSNVGAVVIWDNTVCTMADLGTNFYLSADDVKNGKSRAEASLTDLKTLNPFCRVDALSDCEGITEEVLLNKDVLGTGRPYAAVVVTDLLPKSTLYRINETARANGIAFILAVNRGVTASLFSDFGPKHEITDVNGEPAKMLAVSNVEVLPKPEILKIDGVKEGEECVVVTVAQAEHGLDDGDFVSLDDMRDGMSVLNGKKFKVKRVAFLSPTAAKLDASDVSFKESLKSSTADVMVNFDKQLQFYKSEFEGDTSNANEGKKFAVRTITMFNRLCLVLEDGNDADAFKSYEAGGLLHQVRPSIYKEYKSFAETIEGTAVPQMLRGEDWEGGKGVEVHLAYAAALDFYDAEGRWPEIHSADDATKFLDFTKAISDSRKDKDGACWAQKIEWGFPTGEPRDMDEAKIKRFARLYRTELTGLCAYLGGAAAQEVLKRTGKFTPIDQWIHHDEQCLVCDENPSNLGPLFGNRYDHQIAIMGKDFQTKAADARVFLVGCGALGCEYLKGLALMGVATGKGGKVTVTDMDRIEVSNLSRQFLFRDKDVGTPKSVSGARVVKEWNPRMNVVALEKRVGTDSEDFFSDEFWEGLDVCWNALDNVQARKYTDGRCLFYGKPLLESGTLGTKCNHEVILPHRTSSYNDGKESDENENQIAMCTLRSFPYLPLHCIEFAKQAYFSDYFEFGPDQYETFRTDKAQFFEQLEDMGADERLKSLKMIESFVALQKENGGLLTFASCVKVAFGHIMEDFRTSVLNLCHAADEMEKSEGKKFWTGTKRRPRAAEWTGKPDETPELMEYLYCAANLYAVVWGLVPVRDRAEFQTLVEGLGLEQPEWKPSSEGVDLSEEDGGDSGNADEEVEKLKGELYNVDVASLRPANAHDFEKDEDDNFHVDFLTIATNLRAWNYDIKASQRHHVKVTAGRIIPALATTTAMVCGLVDIEFCKLILGLQNQGREQFLNSNVNLAAGSGNFTTFAPDPPIQIETGLKAPYPGKFTSWDKVEIVSGADEMTTQDLVEFLERSFGVKVERIFAHGTKGDVTMYNAAEKERLDWDISKDVDGKLVVSPGVFTKWPNLRMAVTMLGRLPPTSGQRKIFEKQVDTVKAALDNTKSSLSKRMSGAVSSVYFDTYRPNGEKEAEKAYFDRVYAVRDYVTLGVHCHTADGTDILLPPIVYEFAKGEASEGSGDAMEE